MQKLWFVYYYSENRATSQILESTSKYGFYPDLVEKWWRSEHAPASYPGLSFRPPGFSPAFPLRLRPQEIRERDNIFSPKSGENHIWKYLPHVPDFACDAIFLIIKYKQQFLHENMSIPNQWNFTSDTLNDIGFVFFFLPQCQRQ